MENSFHPDFLKQDQIVHILDRDWIKEQTGYTLRLRPESEYYQSAIEHFNGYCYTDIRVNNARHPVKPIIKNIIHYYVKIMSICLSKVNQSTEEDKELDSRDFDPFNYLDVRGFENYCIEFFNWQIGTPYILKTMLEIMLNNPTNGPLQEQLIYLYKRQPSTPPPRSMELVELWNLFVERIIQSYNEIVVENQPEELPEYQEITVICPDLASYPRWSEILDNPVWVNILDFFEEIQKYNSRMKNDTNMPGKKWLRISWYSKNGK